MRDIEVVLRDGPGALGEFGEVLGRAGVSLEGGGVFGTVAHFLVEEADRARAALEAAGIGPVSIHDVVTLRLDQGTPGQLGAVARRMGDAGVDIRVQYSDHDGRLILVVDPAHRAAAAAIASHPVRG
jgi:hypothetical protein